MTKEERELDGLIDEEYVPSSVERKKAVLMYFFVGIVLALSKEKVSVYEYFHLKQALGWWMTFFVCMVIGIVFVFIPYLWILPLLVFLAFFVVWIVFAKQAREGNYTIDEDKIFMPVFAGLGGRVVSIFELDITKNEKQ